LSLFVCRKAKYMAEEVELRLYGEIGPSFYGMIDDVAVIRVLDEIKNTRKIHVRVNSPGGDYFMGTSIANALKRHPAKVIIHVDALAASAASIIAMGGDKIIMHAGSMMMIHRAMTIVGGNTDDLTRAAEALAKVDKGIVGHYERTGLDKTKIQAMVDAETWMSPEEAVQLGFADEVDAVATGAQAAIPKGWAKNAPQEVAVYSIAACARSVPALTVAAAANKEILARQEQFDRLKSRLKLA
jgi:ATP-dependent Clp protease protease subunit